MRDHTVPQPRARLFHVTLLLLLMGGVLGAAAPTSQAAAPSAPALVRGSVRDAAGRPVAAAVVHIGARALQSAADGTIAASIPIAAAREAVDVEVRAPGFGTWRYGGVELATDHPVELQVVLGAEPVDYAPRVPVEIAAAPFDGPPDYINVGRTFSTACVYPPTNVRRVDRMPFIDYVRNVLPNEWVAGWPAASLDAGAVAAAQFAWSTAFVQRKWTRYSYAFDVLDSTCDQVYKDRSPSASYASTDAAVARMWGAALTRDDKLITTFFRDRDESCVRANSDDCMGQWGSYYRAGEGLDGIAILHYYYDPVVAVRTARALRGLALVRSPDLTLKPGASATLSLCMRNVGTTAWQSGTTNLVAVDPANPANSAYVSPFRTAAWRSAQQPATLAQASAPLGGSGTWSFGISVPANLAPGSYQLVVQPRQADGTPIPTDAPIVWQIAVGGSVTYTNRALLPLIARGTAVTATCP